MVGKDKDDIASWVDKYDKYDNYVKPALINGL